MTKVFYFNQFRECTYVLWDSTKECVIIDPGCFSESERQRLADFISANSLKPVKILLTHGHFDHIYGLEWAMQEWGVPAYLHPDDVEQFEIDNMLCESLGVEANFSDIPVYPLYEGSMKAMGETSLKVIHTPGHTRGSVCFHCEAENVLFSGDTLFQGSIGRCDLPCGDENRLYASLAGLMPSLPRETRVLPGHGYPTTIGEELDNNPYLSCLD